MREILPQQLWIGNAIEARDLQRLYEQRIEAVVDLAMNEPPAQLGREMIYCRVPLLDGGGNPPGRIETAIECLTSLLRRRLRTLVACSAGMSRSPAVAAASLALLDGQPPETWLRRIAAGAPHDISPLLWSAVLSAYGHLR